MLRELYIRNYALIDELRLEPAKGLTIITGETGAGKSILLGALGLVLGNRADSSALFDPARKCIVEGRFDISGYDLETWFSENDLDFEAVTTLRREVADSGKSRAFINDTPVTLPVLKAFAEQVVDLHRQHDTLELATVDFQLQVIDALARHTDKLRSFHRDFRNFRQQEHALNDLRTQAQQLRQDHDYFSFQLSELREAALGDPTEQESLEAELNTLTHAEGIRQGMAEALKVLEQDEYSVQPLLKQSAASLRQAARHHEGLAALLERMDSAAIELADIARELTLLEDTVLYDEVRIQEVENRLSVLYRLQKKHGVQDLAKLLQIQQALEEKTGAGENLETRLEEMEQQLSAQRSTLLADAMALHKARATALKRFLTEANALLPEVALPNGQLTVQHDLLTEDRINENGLDRITFLFSANKGGTPQEIRKVASGGELSRLMLIIRSLVAASVALPTLIFDEIDSGISGETGLRIGRILAGLTRHHQVICITHLPQIASRGQRHYTVYKEVQGQRTYTHVQALNDEERTLEIARMLSGERPGEAAMANARELLRIA